MSLTGFHKKFVALIIVVLCSSLLAPSANALGLSPPTVEVSDLLRDTTQIRTVSLFRAPDDVGDIKIHVQPDEDDVEFFVLEETDLVMLSGQTEISYEFGVTPANAPNGEYELKLRFLKTADASNEFGGNGVSVVTGVTAQILVTVGGEERLEYALASLYALPTEEELDTSVVYSISNTGNVDWRPGKIIFAFFDAQGAQVGEYTLEGEEIEPVRAGVDNQSFTVHLPVALSRGSYMVTAVFYEDDETSQTLETTQPFDVFAPGTLAQSGTLKSLSLNKEEFALGEKAKLSGLFENNGEVDLDVVLITEISREGEILDLIRGNEYTVAPGEQIILSELIDVDEVGDYQLLSYVEYANRQTASVSVSFVVSESVGKIDFGEMNIGTALNSPWGIIGLALFLIIAVLFMLGFKHRKSKVAFPTEAVQPAAHGVTQPQNDSVSNIPDARKSDNPSDPSGPIAPQN